MKIGARGSKAIAFVAYRLLLITLGFVNNLGLIQKDYFLRKYNNRKEKEVSP